MKSIISVLSLAVLIGVAACMSLQEYEDDDEMARDLGWGHFHFHIHIHFHRLLMNDKDVNECIENKLCLLCKNTDFSINIRTNNQTDSAEAKYKGCVAVAKHGKKYTIKVYLGGEKEPVYEDTFEVNSDTLLACIDAKNRPKNAQICPYLYNVDLKNGKLCAKLYDNFRLIDTQLKHERDIGCFNFPKEWLLE